MKTLITLLLSVLSASAITTNKATSLSLSAVQAAVNAATPNSMVKLPAGTVTWNGTLNLNKVVWLCGSGTNATKIISPPGNTVIDYTGPDGKLRISDIYFDLGDFSRSDHTAVFFGSENRQFMIDNCRFRGGSKVIWLRPALDYGVVTHCAFYDSDGEIYPWYSMGNGGATSWELPIELGTVNTLVVEDCVFYRTRTIDGQFTDECVYGQEGARVCYRYNLFKQDTPNTAAVMVDAHGLFGDGPPARGSVLYEFYKNRFECSATYRAFNLRGGTHVNWSNTFSGNIGTIFQLKNEGVSTTGQFDARDRIEETFIWGNTLNGSLPSGQGIAIESGSEPYVVKNVHYFTRPPQDGDRFWHYVPLTYPHPLVTEWGAGGGGTPPEPPVTNPPPVVVGSKISVSYSIPATTGSKVGTNIVLQIPVTITVTATNVPNQ